MDIMEEKKEEREQIVELGNYLGTADRNVQMKHIELLNVQLELAMQEMREEMEGKKNEKVLEVLNNYLIHLHILFPYFLLYIKYA